MELLSGNPFFVNGSISVSYGNPAVCFYDVMLPLMRENINRVYEDVAWFVEKYDYKNRDADWKNSKDAIQRGMQKLRGSDPSLPPYVLKK